MAADIKSSVLENMQDETQLTHLGNDPEGNRGVINPPTYRASTILSPTLESFAARDAQKYTGFSYGIDGTQTNLALKESIATLEGGTHCLLYSSGLSAVTLSLTAFLKPGDHLLMVDSVYGPSRNFCNWFLNRIGVEVTYYNPTIGGNIQQLFQPNTRVVYMESPGSQTFEIQDVPAIVQAVQTANAAPERSGANSKSPHIVTMLDNTWASPLFFKPFDHGVDISIHAGTKYIGGHSDLMLGLATTDKEAIYKKLKDTQRTFGETVAPDVCSLALRGMRTMSVRLQQHQSSALDIAQWFQERPEVKRVLHPGLPGDPGHELWKRDFKGASGLFGVLLHTDNPKALAAMVDGLALFGIGASWGGYESLVIPAYVSESRTAVPWQETGALLRFHIGLEAVKDLKADLAAGFERLNAAL